MEQLRFERLQIQKGKTAGLGHFRWKLSCAHLADDVPVRETDNHTVLGGVVLVLILDDQALTGKEVSLSLWKEQSCTFKPSSM